MLDLSCLRRIMSHKHSPPRPDPRGGVTKQDLLDLQKLVLTAIGDLKETIIMTREELLAATQAQKVQIAKIGNEQGVRFDALTKAIADLQAQINAGEVSPEVAQASTDVSTALQALDDTIPDAVPVPAA